MKEINDLFALLMFSLVLIIPPSVVWTLSYHFNFLDYTLLFILTIIAEYIIFVYTRLGGCLAKKIDELFKTKILTSTYEIIIKEPEDKNDSDNG